MSPQNYNVIIELCGLSISHLFKPNTAEAIWETVVLENTGAPQHGGDHSFKTVWPDNTGKPVPQHLPPYHDRTRTIVITPAKCHTPASEHRPPPTDKYSLNHIADFSHFEPNGEVKFDPSGHVELTKVRVVGGKAFTRRFADGKYRFNSGSAKDLGKCLAFGLDCQPGSSIDIETANSKGDSFKYTLSVPNQQPLVIELHNDCANTTELVDFPYYYNEGKKAVVSLNPVTWPRCSGKRARVKGYCRGKSHATPCWHRSSKGEVRFGTR